MEKKIKINLLERDDLEGIEGHLFVSHGCIFTQSESDDLLAFINEAIDKKAQFITENPE